MIHWETRALKDREAIFDFLCDINPDVAIKTDDLIETKVELLLRHPDLGVMRPPLPGRFLIIPDVSMIVLYTWRGDDILILRVLHQKQQFPA